MRIGALDRKIILQTRTKSKNPKTGEVSFTWANYAVTYAQVAKKKASEKIYNLSGDNNDSAILKATTDITFFGVRYDPKINISYRLIYGGLTYNILSIREIGRNKYLEIEAQAISEGTGQV